jgi:hypothetical protein
MENRSVTPFSWGTVGLAILPGLLIVGARSGLLGWILPGMQQAIEQNDLIPVYVALGIVVVGLIVERRFAVWSFPSLGIILFEIPGLMLALLALFGDPQSSFWQSAPPVLMLVGLAAIAVFFVYRAHKRRPIHVPRLGWVLVGSTILIGLVYVIGEAITAHVPNKWANLLALLPMQLWWLGLILVPVAICLPLARRDGIFAALVVVAYEFALVEGILDPTYSVDFWAYWEPSAVLNVAKSVLSYLPALCFLVVAPTWVFRSSLMRGRILGLLLPPLVALISTDVIASIALRSTEAAYSVNFWFAHGIDTVQLLIALILAAVVYHSAGRQGQASGVPEDNVAVNNR